MTDQLRGQSHCAGCQDLIRFSGRSQMPCCFQAPGWVGLHYDLLSRALVSHVKGEGDLVVLWAPLPGPICPHTWAGLPVPLQPEPGPRTAGGVPLLPEPRLASCLGPCLRRTGIPDSLRNLPWGRGEGSALASKILAHLPGVVGGRWKLTS